MHRAETKSTSPRRRARPAPPDRRRTGPAGFPWLVVAAWSGLAAALLLGYWAARPVPALARLLALVVLVAAAAGGWRSLRRLRDAAQASRPAGTDEITGLGSRRLLLHRLAAVLDEPGGGRCALLLIDLDRFKEVNDALGPGEGDGLLRRLGDRFRSRLRPGETLARLGGDEFAVLVPGATEAAAVAAADRFTAALADSLTVADVEVHLTGSVGIAVAPAHGTDAETLLRTADVAMYEAKRTGAGRSVYSPTADRNTRGRLLMSAELHRALDRGEVVCHYQPQVELTTGRVVGAEALVRWVHPDRGVLPPAEFLALAERGGLIRRLTDVVLRTAVGDCRVWEASGLQLAVSVNLTPQILLEAGLVDHVRGVLAAGGLPAGRLVLEITESSVIADPSRARAVLTDLRDLGVRISIDDYGVGYSSLSYLQLLPVDELKLDRSLVNPQVWDRRAAAIVRTTVDLAHALQLRLVAEGVEDRASLQRLAALGCDRAQGYHIARPMPADLLPAWVRSWQQAAGDKAAADPRGGRDGAAPRAAGHGGGPHGAQAAS